MISKLESLLEKNYLDCVISMTDASYDEENDIYLSKLDHEVYNFDEIVKSMGSSSNYCSPDALVIKNGSLILIEFKNSEVNKRNNNQKIRLQYNVRLKAVEGLLAIGLIMEKKGLLSKASDIYQFRDKFKYIVVVSEAKNRCMFSAYNTTDDSRLRNRRGVQQLFSLNRYEGTLFNKIVTLDNVSFDNGYSSLMI